MMILETSRLLLRTFVVEDARAFYDLNRHWDVIRFTGDTPFLSVLEAKYFIENYKEYEQQGFGRWAVVEKETGRFIGFCGLKLNEQGQVDLGFRFYKQKWGKGFASEAALACIEYGFNTLGLEEIIGRAVKENVASIRVLQKCGMRYFKEGECNGLHTAHYYRITKKEWEMKPSK